MKVVAKLELEDTDMNTINRNITSTVEAYAAKNAAAYEETRQQLKHEINSLIHQAYRLGLEQNSGE